MKHSIYLQTALEAVKKAEGAIFHYYAGEVKHDIKEDKSPVTIADTEVEKIIKGIISKKFPSHGFLGEESEESQGEGEFNWIVDPIDGTKNFIRGIPLFATEIALMHKGEIILGVSNAPVLKELIYAEKGKGAYLNEEQIHVSSISSLENAYLSFGGLKYFEKISLTNNLLLLAQSVGGGTRSFGDFWAYHLLACGKIDIAIEAHVKIWDIAAMKVIVEEAGGMMTDIYGKPVDINTPSIIASNTKLHTQVNSYFLPE